MKIRTKWMAALVALGLVSPFAVAATPTAACRAHGEAAFKAWTHGQYEKVGAHFAPDVAAKLTPGELKQVWGQVHAKAGAFQKLGAFVPRTIQGHEALAAPMRFEKAPLAAVFACDSKDRINSFTVLNPTMVPGLESLAPAASK